MFTRLAAVALCLLAFPLGFALGALLVTVAF